MTAAGMSYDNELVDRTRSGDDAAFDVLFHRHRQSVFNVCLGILGSYEDATDAAQNTFIKAFRAIGRFRGDSCFQTWLYRIARNTSIELIRKRKAHRESALEADIPNTRMPCDEDVWEALYGMSPDMRSVLVLAHFQGLSGSELAQALGCSENAARSRLLRARRMFRQRYEEVGR